MHFAFFTFGLASSEESEENPPSRINTQLISTTNHMFERTTWNKLPECIFDNFSKINFQISKFQSFQKSRGHLSRKLPNTNI